LVARLRLHESSIAARFKFSPKIQTVATFDFCNSIGGRADIAIAEIAFRNRFASVPPEVSLPLPVRRFDFDSIRWKIRECLAFFFDLRNTNG
jgi:hypothetical protein